MKHIGFYLVGLLIFVTSCVDNDFSAGSSFINEQVNNIVVDTTTINLKTVLSDSTLTSGINKIFMGRYESADFGVTNAESFVSFELPTYSYKADFDKEVKYKLKLDSVCLILPYNTYSYGDTTQTQNLNVYKLTERLDEFYTAHDSKLYSNHTIDAETSPYVTKSFKRPTPSMANDSTLIVRLPDAFGQAIMDSTKAQSTIFNTEANFYKYFKGFKFAASSTDKYCINAFKMTTSSMPTIRIYYHSYGAEPIERTITLSANTSNAFSHISQDHSSTPMAGLTSKNGISSYLTGHKSYLQGMVGLNTQLTFPYINSLVLHGQYTNVAAAYLYVYPIKNTYNDFTPLPKNITLNTVSKIGVLEPMTASTTSAISAGVLTEDPTMPGRYYYAFDVTSFVQAEIKAADVDKGTLQLSLPSSSSDTSINTFKSLIIGDSNFSNSDYRIKLVVQLLIKNYD